MKDTHTVGEKMARNGRKTAIYFVIFVSKQSLFSENAWLTLTSYTLFRPISISCLESVLLRYHLPRKVLGVNFVTFTTRKSTRCFLSVSGICYVEKGLL